MNNILSSKYLLSLSIAAVVLVAGGVFAFWQMNQGAEPQPTPNPSPSPTPTPNSSPQPQEIDTSDWQTYRNEELGFEFQYPESAEVESFSSVDRMGVRINLPTEETEVLNKYFVAVVETDLMQCQKDYSFYSDTGQELVIDNQKFFEEYSPELLASGNIADDKNYFRILDNSCLYLTSGFEYDSERRSWESEVRVFAQILSTFKVLE